MIRAVWWNLFASLLICSGLALLALASVPPSPDDAPAFARKVPRPPECPDCGIGAKLTKAE